MSNGEVSRVVEFRSGNHNTALVRAIELVRRAGYTVIEAPLLSPVDVDGIWREAEEYARRRRPGRAA